MNNIFENLKKIGIKPLGDDYNPLSGDDITEIEQCINGKIPADYRAFVEKYGLSKFETLVSVSCIENSKKYPLSIFYGGGQKSQSIMKMVSTFKGRMLSTLIPFAADVFGNQFCIGIGGDEYGTIFFWDHEREPDPDDYLDEGEEVPHDIWYQNLTRIANSFELFINQISND